MWPSMHSHLAAAVQADPPACQLCVCRELIEITARLIEEQAPIDPSAASIKQGATAFQLLRAAQDDEVCPACHRDAGEGLRLWGLMRGGQLLPASRNEVCW